MNDSWHLKLGKAFLAEKSNRFFGEIAGPVEHDIGSGYFAMTFMRHCHDGCFPYAFTQIEHQDLYGK